MADCRDELRISGGEPLLSGTKTGAGRDGARGDWVVIRENFGLEQADRQRDS